MSCMKGVGFQALTVHLEPESRYRCCHEDCIYERTKSAFMCGLDFAQTQKKKKSV